MMTKSAIWIGLCLAASGTAIAQQKDITVELTGPAQIVIAVPDLRGAGEAQQYMAAFNQTLWSDLEQSGTFRMASKSLYPLQVPQRPEDFRRPATPTQRMNGLWLNDWAAPPANASYLTVGYTASEAGQIVLRAWLFSTTQPELAGAQILGKIYLAPLGEEGARKVAHDFAADILQNFGAVSLAGTKIYFVSDRTGTKEIWSMNYDGTDQKQITRYRAISMTPAVSPDGSKLAFTTFQPGNPAIFVFSLETGRRLPFYNPVSSVVTTPAFTPDGQRMLFSYSIGGWPQIFIANADGGGARRITYSTAIDVEPKVNPKTGNEIVFVSGRSGTPQIYRMNMEGADVARLTTGEGDATNPAWHPDGQHIAFAWTRGYAPGHYNIFVMDVAKREPVQLTHNSGRNENPSWAPDGRHIVFSSNRGGSTQIYSMLANGEQLKQLTTQGRNYSPVWGK